MKRRTFLLLTSLLVSPLALGQATDYPNRAVKVIVPFPVGSGADSVARFAAKQLEDILGQPFVIDNRVGANGAIAMAAAKGSPADGYTLVLGSSGTMTINPIFIKDIQYDPVKDFKPVSGLTRTYTLFLVPADSKFKTIGELIAAAKSGKGKLNAGTFTSSYVLTLEWFTTVTATQIMNVPYKSVGQVQTDLLGGQLDFTMIDVVGATPLVNSGKVRALATMSNTRPSKFPDVPTFAESGYPEFVSYLWNGFFVRTEVPNDVTAKLANAMQAVMSSNATAEYLKLNSVDPLPLGPEPMRKYQLDDLALMRSVADKAGIKPE